MKRIVTSALALLLFLAAAPADAQDELLASCTGVAVAYSPTTPPPSQQRDDAEQAFRFLCSQVVNAITNVQPTFGIAFTGGAHTLGTATTIGRRLGLPRVSVTARLNAALADVPDLFTDFQAQVEGGDLPPVGTVGLPIGSLQGDAVIGLFNGFSFGPAIGGIGAVDLLGSVSFIPAIEQTGLAEDIINWGVGARLGLLKQGLLMPGISVSGMYRKMGDVGFGDIDDPDTDDPVEFSTDLSTVSLRAGISKGILAFDLAAGAGYDIYTSNVFFDWVLECPAAECGIPATMRPQTDGENGISGELTTAAWNVYGNVGLSLLLLNIVGEVGFQKATDLITADDLQGAGLPSDQALPDLEGGRFFGSLGVRLTL